MMSAWQHVTFGPHFVTGDVQFVNFTIKYLKWSSWLQIIDIVASYSVINAIKQTVFNILKV